MHNKWTRSGALVLSAVVLLVYHPALSAGFVTDDWWFLRVLLTKSLPEYLAHFLNPWNQFIWYRPLGGLLWLPKYAIFGVDPMGYHLTHVLTHLGNCLALFGLVNCVTHNARMGFLAAIVYATIPSIYVAVLWPSDSQPVATLFALLAVWLWFSHVHSASRVKYTLAVLLALLAILAKGTNITLPIVLFLGDRLLIRKPISLGGLIWRYSPFAVLTPLYYVPMQLLFTPAGLAGQYGYGFGSNVISNLVQYLNMLSFPWEPTLPPSYFWLPLTILFAEVAIRKQSHAAAFLGLTIPATLFPFLLMPGNDPRYLYAPVIIVAILVGLAAEMILRTIHPSRVRWAGVCALSLTLTLLVVSSSVRIADAATFWGWVSKLERLTFRNIAQRHPALPEGTLLYFINATDEAWSTMSLIRYGKHAAVSDVFTRREARLRDYRNPIVIYVDPPGESRELGVDMSIATHASPELPIEFAKSIRLENYELTRTRVKRGEMIGLILYWRATQKPDKDYTVFVHLTDAEGRMIAGFDSQPREGHAPSSRWPLFELVPDGRVIIMPEDVPIGSILCLEIGLYYLPTMQRLAIVDSLRDPIGDRLIIAPIEVIE
jgi:hypothetical protein